MASSALVSQAVFEARARADGLPEATLQLLLSSGVNTMATYASSVQFQPGSLDELPLLYFLTAVLHRAPSIAEISILRRLFYESRSLVLLEMNPKGAAAAEAPLPDFGGYTDPELGAWEARDRARAFRDDRAKI